MTPSPLEIALFFVVGFAALALLWLLYAKIRIELAASAHDEWRGVGDEFGLEVLDSTDLDAPVLRGDLDGISVEVRPTAEDRSHVRGDDHLARQQTTIEAELPDSVPADGLAFESVESVLPITSDRDPRVARDLGELYDVESADDRFGSIREDDRAAEALARLDGESSRVKFRDGAFAVEVDRNVRDGNELATLLDATAAAADGVRRALDDTPPRPSSDDSDGSSQHW